MPDEPVPEPTPEQTPEPTPGGFWSDFQSEDLKNEPTIQRFKNPEDLAKSYLEIRRSLGDERVAIPKDPNDAEAWDSFYERTGMPKDGNYGLEPMEGVPEELGQQDLEGFQKVARDLRLNKSQASSLHEWYTKSQMEAYQNQHEQFTKENQEAEAGLRKEWGLKYDENKAQANAAFQELFGDQANEIAEKIGNNPAAIKGMFKAAELLSEDGVGSFGNKSFTMSPSEAIVKRDGILADVFHPYWGNSDRDGNPIPQALHQKAVEEMESLEMMIHAGQKQ